MKCFSIPVALACLLSALQAQQDGSGDRANPGKAAPTKTIAYREVGGVSLSLSLFEPAGHKPSDRSPAIVFFHGGGWKSGAPSQFFWQSDYLARRGMVAISAQYRLQPKAPSVKDCISDAQAAVAYVRAHAAELGIDPDRIAAGGGSAGGHLAAATSVLPAFEESSRSCKPNLLVLFNPALFHPLAQQTLSLENFVKETPPMVQLYGTEDAMVDYGKQCLERSKKEGNLLTVHVAQGQKHGFFNAPPWRERTTFVMDQFLVQHGYLKGDPTLRLPDGVQMDALK
jgi:acetyl esterase